MWGNQSVFKALKQSALGLVFVTGFLCAIAPAHAADPLPEPTGRVILTVSGAIEIKNSENGADFDRDMLNALGLEEIVTTTAWTDGPQTFRGVRLQTLLERLGASGTTVTATALNDFVTSFPVTDATQYGVLLASEMNGEEMSVRDKGPLWVVYPRDDFPELQQPEYNDRWAWQLRSIAIE